MKKSFGFKKYILVSVFLHFVLVFAIQLVTYLQTKKDSQKVEVTLLTAEDLEAMNAKNNSTQIVETDSAHANNQLDEKAKYNSEKSNTVEKETKAKLGEQFKNAARQGSETKQAQKGQKKSAQQMLANSFDPYAALVKNTNAQEAKEFAKGQVGANAGEASMTNDNLKGVSEDLITKLNTREYKYYGYYHRIKIQLNQWWQPKVREKVSKMVSQGRRIAATDNKVTKLVIILNDAGNLVNVQVLAESGVMDLDAAAVEAFRAAAPFPNPPKGIIESDGKVRIRWDFVVES
ncbi:MAG: TonB family protein [Bdellovibrio sp.]|nr:TonB family protein [Bdellovibrio sp.]